MANVKLFIAVVIVCAVRSIAGDVPECSATDRDALLAFKAGLDHTTRVLGTWTLNTSCCSWRGVACNSRGRITHVSVFSPIGRKRNIVVHDRNLVGATLPKLTDLEVLDLQNLQINSAVAFSTLKLPAELNSLRNLTTISLIRSNFGGKIPPKWSEITSLQNLVLSENPGINSSIPSTLCKLQNLQNFVIENPGEPGALTGPIPACFGSMPQLTELKLTNNQLTGSIPPELGNLRHLKTLSLFSNMLMGAIPNSIGNLQQLQTLNLQGNNFGGEIPASLRNLNNLQEIRLGGREGDASCCAQPDLLALNKQLSGTFPRGFGGGPLKILRIRGTSITGPLPASLGLIGTNLTDISLDNNAFVGTIPSSITAPKGLVTLDLSSNMLEGEIQSTLAQLGNKLRVINFSKNRLSGVIPSSFSNLSLSTLDLSSNQLTGSIPADLGNAVYGGTLNLANNGLTGAFPTSLARLYSAELSNNHLTSLPSGKLAADIELRLEQLFLDSNELSGVIPPWIPGILFVNLANNNFVSPLPAFDFDFLGTSNFNISRNLFTGTLPDTYINGISIQTLDFSYNQFTGRIPGTLISGCTFLSTLVLSHNLLSGPLPDQLFTSGNYIQNLDLSHNSLSGPIPDSFPNANPSLGSLDLSYNQLSGIIPDGLFTYASYLEKLKLDHNEFIGSIPNIRSTSQPFETMLSFILLNDNKLTGTLSGVSWIKDHAEKLTVVDISNNEISGSIPDLSSWSQLRVLNIGRNKFTGSIPPFLFTSLPSLQVLDLSSNKLSGALPSNMRGLKSMINSTGADYKPMKGGPYYEVGGFSFGPPYVVETYTSTLLTTTVINFSNNVLSGPLPASVGSLTGLHVFDVANNKLDGGLPSSLGKIKVLQILDVSNNEFSGRIPSSFGSFPASNFFGNPGLCGQPLAANC